MERISACSLPKQNRGMLLVFFLLLPKAKEVPLLRKEKEMLLLLMLPLVLLFLLINKEPEAT